MSKNFETIIQSATTQFFTSIQNDLIEFVWEKTSSSYNKESLSSAIREFFGEKVEKVEKQEKIEKVEKQEKPKKKTEHTCERKYTASDKTETVCGNNASEQVDGLWVCGKHKKTKAKSKSSKKKPTSIFDGAVGTPVQKKVVGELPNESIPMDLSTLVAEMDGKISEQVDNYLEVVEKDIPKEIIEDLPVEKPQEKVEEPKKEEKVEEPKKTKKEDKKEEESKKKKAKKEEIKKEEPKEEEKTEPLMKIPTLEELEKEEEMRPKKKKILIKKKKVVETVVNPALAALTEE